MKILIRNSDDVVMYADDSLQLSGERAFGEKWQDFNFNSANSRIEVAILPDMWSGAVWSYINGTWSIIDSVQHDAYVAMETERAAAKAAALLPVSVSMRQARLALLAANLLDAVSAAIAQAGTAAQIEWEYASEVRRDSPLIASLTPALGMTSAQIDALFTQAATL